jgi:hypothetical protein
MPVKSCARNVKLKEIPTRKEPLHSTPGPIFFFAYSLNVKSIADIRLALHRTVFETANAYFNFYSKTVYIGII